MTISIKEKHNKLNMMVRQTNINKYRITTHSKEFEFFSNTFKLREFCSELIIYVSEDNCLKQHKGNLSITYKYLNGSCSLFSFFLQLRLKIINLLIISRSKSSPVVRKLLLVAVTQLLKRHRQLLFILRLGSTVDFLNFNLLTRAGLV